MRRRDGPVFVDTWGWFTLGNRTEPRHFEVQKLYADLINTQAPIYTSDYVLDELITLMFQRRSYHEATRFVGSILDSTEQGLLRTERITSLRFVTTWKLRLQLQDKPRISFTDLTSMVIMDELGIQQVLTEDEHFAHVGKGFIRVP